MSSKNQESIAIIGMGCRFPGGVHDLETFWQLLQDGVDAITEIPASRFDLDRFYDPRPATPGKVMTRWGGVLDRIDEFDAHFFGISPREAEQLDPQQRLLLEVAWEALEEAGQTVEQLRGSQTGVFIGQWLSDFEARLFADPDQVNFFMTTGSGRYATSGRISYSFGFQGPSLTLDTACSSSLVAVHLACQSLRSGESQLALVGAANVILQPHISIAYSQSRMMAPDGRCKFGDARANGYVRSEGAAAIVLKRLSDALHDGDPIQAVILGSAVNNDGQSSGFLSTPGVAGQEAMLRQAYQNAGVWPGQIQYVEAHGTGTAAGDPVEIEALGHVLAEGRPAGSVCLIGSVKTNIGHTESVAGLAGLIKVVLSLQHHTLPASLHLQQPNPNIPWDHYPLQIQRERSPWPVHAGQALAGVSAFGIAGTNAHIVLGEAPSSDPASAGRDLISRSVSPDTYHLLPISARSPEAVKALAQAYRTVLLSSEAQVADICQAASLRRSHHDYRLAAVGRTAGEMAARLEAFTRGDMGIGLVTGQKAPRQSGVVFVFPGQGGQWLGMGRQLAAQEPVFRQALERCEQAFRPYVDWSLLEQLAADEARSRLNEIDVVQPMLFAIQVALAELWRSWGVRPEAVVGHSLGEVAAAHVAGVLSLEDAARVICTRSQLMRRASGQGAMAVVELSIPEAQAALAGYEDRLSIAVSNSPRSTVISGNPAALDEVVAALQSRNVFCRPVKVDVAAHSPQMGVLRPALVAALAEIQPHVAAIPLYSTVTGQAISGQILDAAYWGRNLREPVLFAAAVQRLMADGYTTFIEINPHPILLTAIEQVAQSGPDSQSTLVAISSLRRAEDEKQAMLSSLAKLYVSGYALEWPRFLAPREGGWVRLPPYPWQRRRFWPDIGQPQVDPLSRWLYQVAWQPQPHVAPSPPSQSPGMWLIFADRQGVGQRLAAQLVERGLRVVTVLPGEAYAHLSDALYTLHPGQPEHFSRLIREVLGSQLPACQGIVHLWGTDTPDLDHLSTATLQQAQLTTCGSVLHLIQALAQIAWQPQQTPRLWLVTRKAQRVADSVPSGVAQATLWGLGRVIAMEHPELWGGLIDLESDAVDQEAAALLAEGLSPSDEDQIAFRKQQRYVARLKRLQPAAPTGRVTVQGNASYLITGGLGGLGLVTAKWLVEHGARALVLIGRHAPTAAAKTAITQLEEAGARVLVLQADVSQAADLRRVLDTVQATAFPLHGIIHAAGIVEDSLLVRQTWTAFEQVMASKVLGAWNLHQLTQELPLDFFVLFSSASALLGTPSQGNYAAANTFLDALAQTRQALGLPIRCVNWGAWTQVGLAAQADRLTWLARLGIDSFSPKEGLAALEHVLTHEVPQTAVMAINWHTFAAQRPHGRTVSFFSDLVRPAEPAPEAAPASRQLSGFRQQLEAAAPEARHALLLDHVRASAAAVMHFPPDQPLPLEEGFFRLGMDSLMSVELKNRLQGSLGCSVRTTLVFDFPSVLLLTRYLLTELFSGAPAASPVEAQDTAETLLADVQDLSREEVSALLDEELRHLTETM